MPRSDTPCAVGCDERLLVRRNRLNVGICRSTSSATTAGDSLDVLAGQHVDAGRHVAEPLLAARRRDGDRFGHASRLEGNPQGRPVHPGRERLPRLGESVRPHEQVDRHLRRRVDTEAAVRPGDHAPVRGAGLADQDRRASHRATGGVHHHAGERRRGRSPGRNGLDRRHLKQGQGNECQHDRMREAEGLATGDQRVTKCCDTLSRVEPASGGFPWIVRRMSSGVQRMGGGRFVSCLSALLRPRGFAHPLARDTQQPTAGRGAGPASVDPVEMRLWDGDAPGALGTDPADVTDPHLLLAPGELGNGRDSRARRGLRQPRAQSRRPASGQLVQCARHLDLRVPVSAGAEVPPPRGIKRCAARRTDGPCACRAVRPATGSDRHHGGSRPGATSPRPLRPVSTVHPTQFSR